MYVCMYVYMYVCVCERERERERESVCVYRNVCMYVCIYPILAVNYCLVLIERALMLTHLAEPLALLLLRFNILVY
jgi:hypothetical protein